jgi:hypothetical protein
MSKTTSFSHILFLIPLLSLAAAAQTPASKWESLKALSPGTQVRVASIQSKPGSSKPMQGALESVTDSELVILPVDVKSGTGPQSIPRAQIASVFVKKEGHRLRNTLIGMGVGAALGVGIGYGIGRGQGNCPGGCSLDVDGGMFAGGVLGLLGGTFTGLLWPTGGWREVYAP